MKILVFDNYDSFTYNLVHAVEKITGEQVDVFRNDKISLSEIDSYDKIVLSPGPGIPSEAGILLDVVRTYAATKNILGVCLGHQAIGEAMGGELENLTTVFHGVSTKANVVHDDILFRDLPNEFEVGRYHSWVVKEPLPNELIVTARDENGQVMAMKHSKHRVRGVQFHPESILTPLGEKILDNWLKFS
ncbi:MAG: aminodeoxychorismate/anthranilate synthase component II [Flavobacteriales bacterium]|nr:aminodeoxychorismate/anthranilate synthase component II [Flavobacteriales bacterium]